MEPTALKAQRGNDFRASARDTGVIWLGLFALGIGFGMLVTSYGLSWWLAPVMSGLMFAGSAEFILIGMVAATAPLSAIALTTALVNSRHLFYGLSFPLERVEGWHRRLYSVYALCDEAYTLTTGRNRDSVRSGWIVWTQIGLHASWAGGAFVGGVAGGALLGDVEGLGFLLTALFVTLAIDAFRTHRDAVTGSLALGCAVSAHLVAPESMLIVAMFALIIGLVVRHYVLRRRSHA